MHAIARIAWPRGGVTVLHGTPTRSPLYLDIGVRKFLPKFFSNFRSKFRSLSNFQIQLVLQLDLDLDSGRYTCRITNRRLALARSSMPTALTQLVIIMTANVSWTLSSRFVRPQAPTTVGRRPKAPHSPSLSACFWPEPLTALRLAGHFLVVGLVRLLGTTSRLQNWSGARAAKMAGPGSRRPSLH